MLCLGIVDSKLLLESISRKPYDSNAYSTNIQIVWECFGIQRKLSKFVWKLFLCIVYIYIYIGMYSIYTF